MRRTAVALTLAGALGLIGPAAAQKLGKSNSFRQEFRSTDSFNVRGVGCGNSSSDTITLPPPLKGTSSAYDIRVRSPVVGSESGYVRVTAVAVKDQSITITATADAVRCAAEASGPPAEEGWQAGFSPDIRYARRVQARVDPVLIFDQAKPPALRPRRLRFNPNETVRGIRWKRFGGRTARGVGRYRLNGNPGCNPQRCPGLREPLRLNGRRMTVTLSRVKRCGGVLKYTRFRLSYRGKSHQRFKGFC